MAKSQSHDRSVAEVIGARRAHTWRYATDEERSNQGWMGARMPSYLPDGALASEGRLAVGAGRQELAGELAESQLRDDVADDGDVRRCSHHAVHGAPDGAERVLHDAQGVAQGRPDRAG